MSQLPGNFDNQGIPIPKVEVKPVEASNAASEPQKKGWFSGLFDGFDTKFTEGRAAATTEASFGSSSGFDFRSLIGKSDQSDKTNQLLLQLFVFIGLMVIVLFAFKFFKK